MGRLGKLKYDEIVSRLKKLEGEPDENHCYRGGR